VSEGKSLSQLHPFRAVRPKPSSETITILRDDFNAPIAFDAEHNGYYLKLHGWDVACPPLFEKQQLFRNYNKTYKNNIYATR